MTKFLKNSMTSKFDSSVSFTVIMFLTLLGSEIIASETMSINQSTTSLIMSISEWNVPLISLISPLSTNHPTWPTMCFRIADNPGKCIYI